MSRNRVGKLNRARRRHSRLLVSAAGLSAATGGAFIAYGVVSGATPAAAHDALAGSCPRTYYLTGSTFNRDTFYDYDFWKVFDTPPDPPCDGVDWGLDLVFQDHSTWSKIRDAADGDGDATDPSLKVLMDNRGQVEYAINTTGATPTAPPGGWFVHTDDGNKLYDGHTQPGGGCLDHNKDNYHFRVYGGDGRPLYDPAVGYYDYGTPHDDFSEGCTDGTAWSGNNEDAESFVVDDFYKSGYTVYSDSSGFLFNNFRETTDTTGARWYNDGFASVIDIP